MLIRYQKLSFSCSFLYISLISNAHQAHIASQKLQFSCSFLYISLISNALCWSETLPGHQQHFEPSQIVRHLNVGGPPRVSAGVRDLLQWSGPVDGCRFIHHCSLDAMSRHDLDRSDHFATLRLFAFGAKAEDWKLGFWFHVFGQNFYCCRVVRRQVPTNPVGATNKLPDVRRLFERSKLDYGLHAVRLGRSAGPTHNVTQQLP